MVRKKLQNRIKKEITFLKDYYHEKNICIDMDNDDEYKILRIFIKHNDKINYDTKILIHYDYPFKPPDVYLSNVKLKDKSTMRYYNFFTICSNFYYDEKNSFQEYECPCCYNMMCSWHLNLTILDIMKDIKKFDNQFKRLRSLYYFKKIKNNIRILNQDNIKYIEQYI